jgi:hypothetical protein
MPKSLENYNFKLVLSNVEHAPDHKKFDFEPYEVRIYQKR